MKIAVFFNANPDSGGAFQDQWNVLNALKDYALKDFHKHKILVITANKEVAEWFKDDFEILNISVLTKIIKSFKDNGKYKNKRIKKVDEALYKLELEDNWEVVRETKRMSFLNRTIHKFVEVYLKSKGIDLVIYPGPMASSFKINIPYIIKIYDLGHRIIPHFPELSANGEYERREYLHENVIKNATAIIVDSKQGKEDIINHYDAEKEKIFPLKHLPPTYLKEDISKSKVKKTLDKYNIKGDYFYYPAQLWPHKNHILIIKAIELLKDAGTMVHVVFSGSDKPEFGVLKELDNAAIELGVSDLVHYLGYVSNEEVNVLYKQSKGLVMASFLGPSNIPYFEAFKIGVPVIAMDVPGIKEQVQDAAIMVNPNDPVDLMTAMEIILKDKLEVKNLIANGKKVLKQWTNNDYKRQLFKVIDYAEEEIKNE